jgi:hypothetical protein
MDNQALDTVVGQDEQLGVVDQVIVASRERNRLATAIGFLLGGIVPIATYLEAHVDLDPSLPLYAQIPTYLVIGGLAFSAKTVFDWARMAFKNPVKAAGFVLLLEGVMVTSHVPVLPLVLLAVLVSINGVATGCLLSLSRTKTLTSERKVKKPSVGRRAKRAAQDNSDTERSSGITLKAAA